MEDAGRWRAGGAGRRPGIARRVVSAARIGKPLGNCPPQTTILVPAQTAVCDHRPAGASVVEVAVQVSVTGRTAAAVQGDFLAGLVNELLPPHTIIVVPVHTAVCMMRGAGALSRRVEVHVSRPPSGSVNPAPINVVSPGA